MVALAFEAGCLYLVELVTFCLPKKARLFVFSPLERVCGKLAGAQGLPLSRT